MLARDTALQIARLLNEVVVSGDRMGSTFHDDEERLAREWYVYLQEVDFWRRAAELRGLLFDALWDDEGVVGDEEIIAHDARVEAELAPRLWTRS
jgi:hypothetical protein